MTLPRCPSCRTGGYNQSLAHDQRPLFTCTQCGHKWTSGADGGEYNLEHIKVKDNPPVTKRKDKR